MCDHCRTYKPLVEKKSQDYERSRSRLTDETSSAKGTSCCSWRQSCCSGGCCSKVRNCCSTEPEARDPRSEKAPVGYGYGYGRAETGMGIVGMTGIPYTMPGGSAAMIPCPRREEKLPMCHGGDCKDSSSCENSKERVAEKSAKM